MDEVPFGAQNNTRSRALSIARTAKINRRVTSGSTRLLARNTAMLQAARKLGCDQFHIADSKPDASRKQHVTWSTRDVLRARRIPFFLTPVHTPMRKNHLPMAPYRTSEAPSLPEFFRDLPEFLERPSTPANLQRPTR